MSKYGGYESKEFLPELYDLCPRYKQRADMDFYLNICQEQNGKVLELGCGTGRVLIPIAQSGLEITGLDLSPYMLAKCRENLAEEPQEIQNRIQLVQGTMTDFDLGEKFSSIIIPFRPFQHLIDVKDQMACLQCAQKHLADDGVLVFDLFQVNFSKINNPEDLEEKEDFPEMEIPDGRTMRRNWRFAGYHPSEQYNECELIYYITDKDGNTERLVHDFPFRYFFRYEVEHLLARCGLKIKALYGNFDKSPLVDESPEMIFVASKAGDKG